MLYKPIITTNGTSIDYKYITEQQKSHLVKLLLINLPSLNSSDTEISKEVTLLSHAF